MRTLRIIILSLSCLLLFQTASAQEIDFLQKAREFLAEGKCDSAQIMYNAWKGKKENKNKTNAAIEQAIAECRKPSGNGKHSNDGKSGDDLIITANGVSFTMKYVEGGTFWMGAQKTNSSGQNYDSEADDDERPVHSVTLSNYYMGETEVTQALWFAVMGSNPSHFKGDDLPVECVSWNDCQEFIRKLNQLTGKNFRLPTEAEWEYAARGGKMSKGYKYAGGNTIGNVAWYTDNNSSKTHMVKTKSPNELGLYDMSGNVWEWCSDRYGSDYYSKSPSSNPTGPSSGSRRVLRGGGWSSYARYCRVSDRCSNDPGDRNSSRGFRLALPQ